jgi:proton-dependent oligopeptide transporter, POT family
MEAKTAVFETEPKQLFGHPRGLSFLFATEMWERFSYYGMRALLVLYLVKYVLLPEHSSQVIGLATLKGGLETIFGPLEAQPFASQIYGTYTALVYLTPVFGGLLADRVLGQRKTVVIGASLMAIGHFMMAFEPLLLFALLTLILANGLFKPNISTQVGGLYPPGDPRRDRAFSIFYVGINVGAFIAPLICGTLGQRVGWHYGFAAAGVGMVLGLIFYLLNQDKLPVEPLPTESKSAPILGVVGFIVAIPIGIMTLLWLLTLPKVVPVSLAVLAIGSAIWWMIRLPKDERPRVFAIVIACLIDRKSVV